MDERKALAQSRPFSTYIVMGWICLIFHNGLRSRNLISCHSFLNGLASLSGHEVKDVYQKQCYAPPVSEAGTTLKREYKMAKCLLPTSDVLGRPQHRVCECLAYCATMLTPFFHVATCMLVGNNHSWPFTFSVAMRRICTHDVGGWLPRGCPFKTAIVTQSMPLGPASSKSLNSLRKRSI